MRREFLVIGMKILQNKLFQKRHKREHLVIAKNYDWPYEETYKICSFDVLFLKIPIENYFDHPLFCGYAQ